MMLKISAKFKEYTMKTENLLIVSIVISVLAGITAITYNNQLTVKSMERNIESAIVKGIDPIAVKCAYESHSSNLCIAYASRK